MKKKAESKEGEVAPSCHVSVKPKVYRKKTRKFKMCKDLLLSDLEFNKERFSSLLEFESRSRKRFQFIF